MIKETIRKIDRDNVIDKLKEIFIRVNEWWDSNNKINTIGIMTVGLMLSLIFMSKISLFVVVFILGVQRVVYHGKFLSNEDVMPDIVDEDIDSM